MTQIELLDWTLQRLPKLETDALAALEGMDRAMFNAPVDGEWSVARVLRHLVLSHGPYATELAPAIDRAPSAEDMPIKHTFLGGQIRKFAGPQGNAPVPKAFEPEPSDFELGLIDEWKGINARILELAARAKGRDLTKAKFKNPIIKFLKMNACDGFGIVVDHTDRHVRQIVDRSQRLRSAEIGG